MLHRFILILLVVSAVTILPFQQLYALDQAPPQQDAAGVPSQLKPPSEDVAQLDAVIDDSSDIKPYHIPMILNDSVENHLEYCKTRGRDVFQLWLDRSAQYIPVMKDIFREKNLPEDLVYVAMSESADNPKPV